MTSIGEKVKKLEEQLDEKHHQIQKYLCKKKRIILCCFLLSLGVCLNMQMCFPLRINLNELDTDENNVILEYLCENPIVQQYFDCRSLKSIGKKDKKRLQNVIKQMAIECNLIVKRSPQTIHNQLNNEKTTKQNYIISMAIS